MLVVPPLSMSKTQSFQKSLMKECSRSYRDSEYDLGCIP